MSRYSIITNGYAYPFISKGVLQAWLPNLTYVSAFSYGLTPEGTLLQLSDEDLLNEAEAYNTAPLMVLTAYTENSVFDMERASKLFNDPELQDKYIADILETLRSKNMKGVDFDFEYIQVQDRDRYSGLIKKTSDILNSLGYVVMAALAPKTSTDQPGLLYQGHDYYAIGQAADKVLLMTYEWGYTYLHQCYI